MNELAKQPPKSEKDNSQGYYRPHYQIEEQEGETVVWVELPGVAKDDLNLTLEKRDLILVAGASNHRPESWKVLHRESADRTYRLRLHLGNYLDCEAIEADMQNGVLALTLPKAETVKPRKIKIK